LGGSEPDYTEDIALDNLNNYLYVVGETFSFGPGSPDESSAFILKLDSEGNLIWQRIWYAGPSIAWGVDVDFTGNVYISGQAYPYGYTGFSRQGFLAKFNQDGNLIWDYEWGGIEVPEQPISDTDEFRGISLHLSEIYIGGWKESVNPRWGDYDGIIQDPSVGVTDYPALIEDVQVEVIDLNTIVMTLDPASELDIGKALVMKIVSFPEMYAVVTGINNRLYWMKLGEGLIIPKEWNAISSGSSPSGPSAVVYGNRIYFAVRGSNNKIYYGYIDKNDGEFSGWLEVGGYTPSSPALTINRDTGALYMVVRGMDNGIYYNVYENGVWSGWSRLPGKTSAGPAAAFINNKLHIVVRGFSDTSLWHGWIDFTTSSPSWSGWSKIPGATSSSPDLSIDYETQELFLAVRGLNNKIYINRYCEGIWQGWERIPTGSTTQSPAIYATDGKIYVMVSSSDYSGRIYLNVKDSSGNWYSWQLITGRTLLKPELT